MAKVLVLYYSSYGHTEAMANAVAEGAREAGAEVDIKRVPELVPAEIARKSHFKLDQAGTTMSSITSMRFSKRSSPNSKNGPSPHPLPASGAREMETRAGCFSVTEYPRLNRHQPEEPHRL